MQLKGKQEITFFAGINLIMVAMFWLSWVNSSELWLYLAIVRIHDADGFPKLRKNILFVQFCMDTFCKHILYAHFVSTYKLCIKSVHTKYAYIMHILYVPT
jgi:hypothetical protein